MSEQDVQIVRLPAMRMARGWAFGPSPEEAAWQKLESWARPRGLLTEGHRVFGFNNPSPTTGSPNYGYEFQVTIGTEVQGEGDIEVVEFAGGRYAVMPLKVLDPGAEIPAGWQNLDRWVHEHGYRPGQFQWLEEHDTDGHIKAVCYAIAE